EAGGAGEAGGGGEWGDGLLAGVDEVGVDGVVGGERAHAEHAVLGVEGDVLFGAQVVGDEGGRADAEVDERTGRDVGRDERGEFVAVAQGRGAAHAGPPVVTTWSVWMPGVTTCSGSM